MSDGLCGAPFPTQDGHLYCDLPAGHPPDEDHHAEVRFTEQEACIDGCRQD